MKEKSIVVNFVSALLKTLSGSVVAKAKEISVIGAQVLCASNPESQPKKYSYSVSLVLKNNTDEAVTAITGSLTVALSDDSLILNYKNPTEYKGMPLIPSAAELRLVTLYPNEATTVQVTKDSNKLLSNNMPIVSYVVPNLFNGRFSHWTGEARIYDVAVKACFANGAATVGKSTRKRST
ncbi:MAG: hypothetical protein HKM24_00660 [Gammaproteobacteria bacterium]|nr:hypothetical protein [Gammaproteobacteria bacterium]